MMGRTSLRSQGSGLINVTATSASPTLTPRTQSSQHHQRRRLPRPVPTNHLLPNTLMMRRRLLRRRAALATRGKGMKERRKEERKVRTDLTREKFPITHTLHYTYRAPRERYRFRTEVHDHDTAVSALPFPPIMLGCSSVHRWSD